MTQYLLDTNVISNVTKPMPSEALLGWMAQQDDLNLYISSLTVAEIRRGVLEKPPGARRKQLDAWFRGRKVHKRCLPIASLHLTKRPPSFGPR